MWAFETSPKKSECANALSEIQDAKQKTAATPQPPPNACAGKRTSRYFAAFAISRTVASFDSKSEFSGKAIFWKPVFSW